MTGSPGTFEQFLLWERASRDTLEVKRTYIDMAGDLVAGVVLSQIVYWHLPSRAGKPRLQVEREGELWLAKSRSDWWEECRISPKQADRALEVLEERGLIEVKLFKFGAAPTKHIRILHESFLRAWQDELRKSAGDTGPTGGPSGSDFPQRSKSISTKGENPFPPKVKIDLPQRVKSLTEITTETTTAAAPSPAEEPRELDSAAAAALLEELVSHGVSRSVARQLAAEKPAVCRRCLAYLPYAEIRTSRGAWLANAIRDEYGPPPGYEKARAEAERFAAKQKLAALKRAQMSQEVRLRQEKEARLREAYRSLQGEALSAFRDFVEQERTKAARVVVHLSAKGREAFLAAFEAPERRLELFEDWVENEGRGALQSEAARPPA